MTGHLHFSIAVIEAYAQSTNLLVPRYLPGVHIVTAMVGAQETMQPHAKMHMHRTRAEVAGMQVCKACTCHLRMCLLSASRALPGHGTFIVWEMLFSAEKSIPAQKFFPCPLSSIYMGKSCFNDLRAVKKHIWCVHTWRSKERASLRGYAPHGRHLDGRGIPKPVEARPTCPSPQR